MEEGKEVHEKFQYAVVVNDVTDKYTDKNRNKEVLKRDRGDR